MVKLPESLKAWPDNGFQDVLKVELEALDKTQLPLQEGLSQGSHVGPSPFRAMVLGVDDGPQRIQARAGLFYTGIIAGCSCADDPTPVDELSEYCEVRITLDKRTAGAEIELDEE